MTTKPVKVTPALTAAYNYVEKVAKPDLMDGAAPLFYGHAVRSAFVAGIEWQKGLTPPGTLRFDLPEDEWFKNDTGPYPLYECLDCRQKHYGPVRIEHKPECRVAAALADRAAQTACDKKT